jgi:signal transduction histidine kinase
MAKNKNLHLGYDVAPDLPLAWADSRLIERVIQNLLDNAIKFTDSGAEIHVKAGLESEDNDWSLVSVSDSGPGIPADIRDRRFLKFTTARHQQSGTGLGLAFCKMAVEAHGGRIWVESQEGHGATFYFTLPPLPATGKKR